MALRPTETGLAPLAHESGARRTALLSTDTLATVLWLIALALAAVYLVVFTVQLPRNLAELAWNSSVASGYVMPETIAKVGMGGVTVMGSTGQWVSLWFGLLTAQLPGHRDLWSIAPTLLFVASAAMLGWAVAQVGGRRPAILAVLISVAASPVVLAFMMSPFSHNTVYPCATLVGAYLIWLTRAEGRARALSVVVPPVIGVVVGVCLASDFLLAAAVLIPLAIAAALAALQRDRLSRLLAFSTLGTIVVAIPAAKLTSTTMGSLGYVTLPTPLKIASLSELPQRARLLSEGLKALFNGYVVPEAPHPWHSPLGTASIVVMYAALIALIVVGVRVSVRLILAAVRRAPAREPSELARSVHIVYWFMAAAATCGAFWITGEGPTATHYSYYATVVYSVAAVVPLLMVTRSPARWLVPAGASVYFAAGLVGLGGDYFNLSAKLARNAPAIERIAKLNHVQYGYSDWPDASGLTWGSHGRVVVRPLVECQGPESVGLCPGFQAYVPSWYVPRERHTFLLMEANGLDLSAVPASLGKPLAVYPVGEDMSMYIYPYDIASRLLTASG